MPVAVYRFDLVAKRMSEVGLSSPTAAFTDYARDLLFVAQGTTVSQVEAGVRTPGVWRSREYVFNRYPSFGWARVNASFGSGLVVRVYKDGVLYYTTPTITTKDPVRLPAGKAKRWSFEVEGADLATSLVVATTASELV